MYRYIVESVDFTIPSVLSLTLKAEDPARCCMFAPGQYAALSFYSHGRPTAVRCFSVASAPTSGDTLHFGIRVGGKFTKRLAQLKPGEHVIIRGPFGHFIFEPDNQSQTVMCAGGIGITPFLSMMRHATSNNLTNQLTLIYAVRNQEEIPFQPELAALAAKNPHIRLLYAVSDGPVDKLTQFVAYKGRISPDIIMDAASDDMSNRTFFICGPPPYMHAVIDMLRQLGATKQQIITEAFTQGTGGHTRKTHWWQFNIYSLGAAGLAAASVTVMASDILKTLPTQLLPRTLTSAELSEDGREKHNRQADLDNLVQALKSEVLDNESPSTSAAKKEVSEAEAKIAEVNAQNAANAAGTTYIPRTTASTTTVKQTTNATTTTPTTAPTTPPKQPVCTTSPSGVTTCV